MLNSNNSTEDVDSEAVIKTKAFVQFDGGKRCYSEIERCDIGCTNVRGGGFGVGGIQFFLDAFRPCFFFLSPGIYILVTT